MVDHQFYAVILINMCNYSVCQDIYPVNHMRNVAVNGSVTDRLLLLDIDFVPCPGLLKTLQKINVAPKQVKVIAAFEIVEKYYQRHSEYPLIPNNTEELMQAWSRGLVQPFK